MIVQGRGRARVSKKHCQADVAVEAWNRVMQRSLCAVVYLRLLLLPCLMKQVIHCFFFFFAQGGVVIAFLDC